MPYMIKVSKPNYSIVFEYDDLVELSEGLTEFQSQLYRLQYLINEALKISNEKFNDWCLEERKRKEAVGWFKQSFQKFMKKIKS